MRTSVAEGWVDVITGHAVSATGHRSVPLRDRVVRPTGGIATIA